MMRALARALPRAIVLTAAVLAAAGCAGPAPLGSTPGGTVPGWRERTFVEVPRAGGEPCLVEKPEPYDARHWVHDFAAWVWQCVNLGKVTGRLGGDA